MRRLLLIVLVLASAAVAVTREDDRGVGATAPGPVVHGAYRADFDVATLKASGNPANRYDIGIVANMYAAGDIASSWAQMAQYMADCFTADNTAAGNEPYTRYARFINFHRVDAISNDSGSGPTGTFADSINEDRASGPTALSIMNDSLARAGITADARLATAPAPWIGYANATFAEVQPSCEHALHESGHTFHSLADEYKVQAPGPTSGPDCVPDGDNDPANLSRQPDPTLVKWRRWIGYDRAGDSMGPIVVYSPGAQCLYRPVAGAANSRMWAGGGFTAVDKERIIRSFYAKVRPVDSATPDTGALQDQQLWVRVVDPSVIKLRWTVAAADGHVVASRDGGAVFDTTALGLAAGSYTVTAHAFDEAVEHAFSDRDTHDESGVVVRPPDDLDLVRDPALLAQMQQDVVWQVSLTGGPPQSVAPALTRIQLEVDRGTSGGSTVGWMPPLGPATTMDLGGLPGLSVDGVDRIMVSDPAALQATTTGIHTGWIDIVDSSIGLSRRDPVEVVIVDHTSGSMVDDFDDGRVATDLNGGRGFRTASFLLRAEHNPNAVTVTETAGVLRLDATPGAGATVRTDETFDIHRSGSFEAQWDMRSMATTALSTVVFAVFDNSVGDDYPTDFARGLSVVLTAGGGRMQATDPVSGRVILSTWTARPPSAAPFSIRLVIVGTRASAWLDTTLLATAELPSTLLAPIGTDHGPWGRRTQALTTIAVGTTRVDIERVSADSGPAPANGPPSVASVDAQSETVGAAYSFDVDRFVVDPDRDPLTYTFVGLPPGVVGSADGRLTGRLTVAGSWDVQVAVSDPSGQTATLVVPITVIDIGGVAREEPAPLVLWRLDDNFFESVGTIGGNDWGWSSYAETPAVYTPGLSGSAARLRGLHHGIALRSHPDIAPTKAQTISVWAKPAIVTGNVGPNPIFVRRLGANELNLTVHRNGTFREVAATLKRGRGAPVVTATFTPTDALWTGQAWHHFAVRLDADSLDVFLDGSKVATAPYSGPIYRAALDSGDIVLGGDTTGAYSYQGDVDEVALWDQALGDREILGLARQPLSALPTTTTLPSATTTVLPTTSTTAPTATTAAATPPVTVAPTSRPLDFVSINPARILDTRTGFATVDTLLAGGGSLDAGSTLEVAVTGRGGVAADALAVSLNVTAVDAGGDGYLTVWPCGSPRPTASNVNYVLGATVANAVLATIGSRGAVCVYTSRRTHLVVDVSGFAPHDSTIRAMVPARILDTRVGERTVDGLAQGEGANPGGRVLRLQVGDRAGVASGASAVALNVTALGATVDGFVTVYRCGGVPPTASSLNVVLGGVVANLVVTQIGADGSVCLFTQSTMDLVVDVDATFAGGSTYRPLVPARLLETRPGLSTADGLANGTGPRAAGSVTQLPVAGRGGVSLSSSTVVLNVTVVGPSRAGYATVYPCGIDPPLASNINFSAGQTVPNAVIVRLGTNGTICVVTSQPADLVVDVTGAFSD